MALASRLSPCSHRETRVDAADVFQDVGRTFLSHSAARLQTILDVVSVGR